MSTSHDSDASSPPAPIEFVDRHYFLLRRLHSLSGVAPIGLFLFPHLTTNSSIVWGRLFGKRHLSDAALERAGALPDAGVEAFQHEVDFIHSLPALPIIEWTVLFLPIIFHAALGIVFASSARYNVHRYGYQDNWRYTLQRLSGYVGVVFIFMHLTSLRFRWDYGGLMVPFEPDAASSSTAMHFQESPLGLIVPLFYAVSVLLLVFHFANGLWTAAITWGLTISARAQRRWGAVCAAIGLLLSVAGITAIVGFSVLDVDQAQRIEAAMKAEKAAAPDDGSSARAPVRPGVPGDSSPVSSPSEPAAP